MKIGGIIKNDFSAAPGVCVTVFVQGCSMNPHCPGCHNPELWDFKSGRELTKEELHSVVDALGANGIERDLCVMGGEPLCKENLITTLRIISYKEFCNHNPKVYIWSGYTYNELIARAKDDFQLERILEMSDYLIDGPFKQEERDVTLCMRGSRNQRITDLRTGKDVTDDFENRARTSM